MARAAKRNRRILFIGLAGAIGTAALSPGFTASNVVAASKAGDGSGIVSGYNVSTVHYVLNGIDPTKIDGVTFNLDTAPVAGSAIKVQLTAGGSWFSCTSVTTAVTCVTTAAPQPTVAATSTLRVIVAQ